ncbi:spore gernimation protein GerPD [Cohnella sp. AR92]|uniref:spore gernimation protein GerPD n=1 Tax=Cohnella sp. AR92 TaxID=648716 RepID=UPI000F8EF783|nr:spore gernimation protein GerPD [Cohnella sp. AR92]RUS46956.1 spore gernimation protein GerPD [Cohnella sp. AR92]
MRMTVENKCIFIGKMDLGDAGATSLILIGDAESIVTSSYFDTPTDSLIFNPHVPLTYSEEKGMTP